MSIFIKEQSIDFSILEIPVYPYNRKLAVTPLLTSNKYDLFIWDHRTIGILYFSSLWNFLESEMSIV